MTVPAFTLAVWVRSPGPYRENGKRANNASESYSLTSKIEGTNLPNSFDYGMGAMFPTDLIRESKLVEIATNALKERQRRGASMTGYSLPAGYFTGQILASRVQDIISAVQVAGPTETKSYNGANQNINSSNGLVVTGSTPTYDSYGNPTGTTPTYGSVPAPEIVTYPQAPSPTVGTSFSKGQKTSAADINVLIGAINAAGNVCTCNCNYCTCNCNYCTCNCNYSCTCNCNYSDERLKVNVEYL
jgi:hypothetical protein